MRRLLIAGMLFFLCFVGVSLLAQNTPPGGDMVGSDRPVTSDDVRSSPTASPDANQRMTHSSGASSGYENTPAFAGKSTYGTATQQQSPGRSGIQGQTPAIAGRMRAQRRTGGIHSAATPKGSRRAAGKRARRRTRAVHRRPSHGATAPPRPGYE